MRCKLQENLHLVMGPIVYLDKNRTSYTSLGGDICTGNILPSPPHSRCINDNCRITLILGNLIR